MHAFAIRKPPVGSSSPPQQQQAQQQCFDPLPWDTYFDARHFAEGIGIEGDSARSRFRYYTKGGASDPHLPLVFLLHGGGFSGLSWGAMCACLTAKAACRCVAMDVRGHGETEVPDETDFSLDTLAGDAAALIERLLGGDDSEASSVILVGHSMGGAIATHLAQSGRLGHGAVSALVVIDVVEGSAMEALSSMRSYLAGRPTRFPSLPCAIQWCYRSGTVRNLDSARVSFPGHLKLVQPPSVSSQAQKSAVEAPPSSTSTHRGVLGVAIQEEPDEEAIQAEAEEEEEEEHQEQPRQPRQQPRIGLRGPALLQPRANKPPLPSLTPAPAQALRPSYRSIDPTQPFYTWRIDLGETEPHWAGWFAGMSRKFLDAPAAKLLLLAGVDRLDRELTVGQMQGKFQMQVLPRSGHAVHEDHPDHVAEVVASFLVRHKFTQPLAEFHPVPPGC